MKFTIRTEWLSIDQHSEHFPDEKWFAWSDRDTYGRRNVCCVDRVEYHFGLKLSEYDMLRFAASNEEPEHSFWTIEEVTDGAPCISESMEDIADKFRQAGMKYVWMELR